MKGIKNRGSQVHGRYKSKPKHTLHPSDLEYDLQEDEYKENKSMREFYDFIEKYRVTDTGTC